MNYTKLKNLTLLLVLFSTALLSSFGQINSKEKIKDQLTDKVLRIDFPIPGSEVSGIIRVSGRHNILSNSHVWILLFDGHGYYLQSPRVNLSKDGTWNQNMVSLGGGIISIKAVLVGDLGHDIFNNMVTNRQFGQFGVLPNDCHILDEVVIQN